MNYKFIKKLPSAAEILHALPLSKRGQLKVAQDRAEVKAILSSQDKRKLMIIGPCSAWPKAAVLEYAERLQTLNAKVNDVLKLIMRVYLQKPRTTTGWAGAMTQPDLFVPPDIEAGMIYTRDMMLKIVEMGLPIADEALFIQQAEIFLDCLSWVAIGARSSENQEHRVFASALPCAVGLKNPTHGALRVAVNSVIAAQDSHAAVFTGHEVRTNGNPYAHLVLRGSEQGANYSLAHLHEVREAMQKAFIAHPSVIIDASHDNCLQAGQKNYRLQPEIVREVMKNVAQQPDLKKLVKGFMVESFLKEGNQKIEGKSADEIDCQGLSITDPCLGWEQTEDMLLRLADEIKREEGR